MVRLPKVDRETEEDLFDIAYDLELEYDCVIDVIVLPQNLSINIPLYQNILKEGWPFDKRRKANSDNMSAPMSEIEHAHALTSIGLRNFQFRVG